MKIMVNHQTHYHYDFNADHGVQYIKMTPQTNSHQQVLNWNVAVHGEKQIQQDCFDNIWITSTQIQPYQTLSIMAQGVIETDFSSSYGIESHIDPYLFLQTSPYTSCSVTMQELVDNIVNCVTKANLIRLAEAILAEMPYSPMTTDVTHTASDAFKLKKGVCQDHTHVFLAMCRYKGIPARYVSGYLYLEGQAHLASHAWAEAYIEGQWHCFDVSNQLFAPNQHIYVAIGRDYWDVAPVRGVRCNGGEERMSSVVQVMAC